MKSHIRLVSKTGMMLLAAGLTATPILLGSPTAMADELVHREVNQTVQDYGDLIESQYTNPNAGGEATGTEKELARLNGVESDQSESSGLTVSNVDVYTTVSSYSTSAEGASVLSDVTVKRRLTPEPGTTIVIAGEQRDHLDSEYTETHLLELQGTATGGYEVADDTIVNTDGSYSKPDPNPNEEAASTTTSSAAGGDTRFTRPAVYTARTARTYAAGTANRAGLDYIKAMQYAELWTDAAHKDKMNPKYPDYGDNNCTNFVSQAIEAGGLKTTAATVLNRNHEDVWTGFIWGTPKMSTLTWHNVEANYTYMSKHSNAFTVENNVQRIGGGGLVYADWQNDGKYDHAMIVVGYIGRGSKTGPVVCGKSGNTHDIPLADITVKHRGMKWKGLQWKP